MPFMLATASTANTVASALSGVDLTTILQETISLLPVVLPLIVTFIGIRKAISFLTGALHSA